jgi:hypothetical protein
MMRIELPASLLACRERLNVLDAYSATHDIPEVIRLGRFAIYSSHQNKLDERDVEWFMAGVEVLQAFRMTNVRSCKFKPPSSKVKCCFACYATCVPTGA